MKRLIILGVVLACFTALCLGQRRSRRAQKVIQLTDPNLAGTVSFEQALAKRRSVRQFSNQPIKRTQIGQLAWAGQGITDSQSGLRTAPSAGKIYPIELLFATDEGLFAYQPAEHSMLQISDQDIRMPLAAAASMQESIATAGCDIIVAGSVRKLTPQFRNKARTYMLLEAGHIAQNIQLQAVCLGLGSVAKTGTTEATSGQTGSVVKRAVLIVASENFRDEELFETKRALDAVGVDTVIASTRLGMIRGALGNIAEASILVGQIRVDDYGAIVFVGGPGAVEYFTNPFALNIAREAVRKRKVLAAISVAPTILANAGVLTGIRATSFLSERGRLIQAGAVYTGIPVEQDRLIITATGPVASIQFGRAIADALTGR